MSRNRDRVELLAAMKDANLFRYSTMNGTGTMFLHQSHKYGSSNHGRTPTITKNQSKLRQR